MDNDTHFKLPSLERWGSLPRKEKHVVEEQEAKHAALSRAALPFLAARGSLEPASSLVSQVAKAAFFELPGFPKQV